MSVKRQGSRREKVGILEMRGLKQRQALAITKLKQPYTTVHFYLLKEQRSYDVSKWYIRQHCQGKWSNFAIGRRAPSQSTDADLSISSFYLPFLWTDV